MYKPCEICYNKQASQRHHKFSNRKWARKLYGKLLDNEKNIQYCCPDCHVSHSSPKLKHWDEKTFCFELGIDLRSKVKC